jgi:hypothetical protein
LPVVGLIQQVIPQGAGDRAEQPAPLYFAVLFATVKVKSADPPPLYFAVIFASRPGRLNSRDWAGAASADSLLLQMGKRDRAISPASKLVDPECIVLYVSDARDNRWDSGKRRRNGRPNCQRRLHLRRGEQQGSNPLYATKVTSPV